MEQIIEITLIPLVLFIVQVIKTLMPKAANYAIAIVLFVSLFFAVLLVDWSLNWQVAILAWLAAVVQIAAGASGVYSWGKKKDVTIDIPDYSDEK